MTAKSTTPEQKLRRAEKALHNLTHYDYGYSAEEKERRIDYWTRQIAELKKLVDKA